MAGGKPSPGRSAKQIAARAETDGNGLRTVETQGLTLTVPTKIPFAVLRYLEGDIGPAEMVGVLKTLLKPADQIDKVWDAELDIEQGGELIKALIESGGVGVGESLASRDS
jgi:hypothetical protein